MSARSRLAALLLAALAAAPAAADVEVRLKLPMRARLDLTGMRTLSALPFIVVGREGSQTMERLRGTSIDVQEEFERYLLKVLRRETGLAFPGLAFFNSKTVEMQIEEVFVGDRYVAGLCAAFALLATLLAAVGLYGVMAWSVARRTREIGIRMALGAERRAVIGMVLREVALLAGVGVAIGVPVALALSRLVRTQLYGLAPHDPLTFAAAAALISAVALAAGFLPAHRASRVDPLTALRYE